MELVFLSPRQLPNFKSEMQEAFQKGFEDVFGKSNSIVLPAEDIDRSLAHPRSVAVVALEDGVRLGGAIVVLSDDGTKGDLHFLYVKVGAQNRGVGSFIWRNIESRFSYVKEWETCTPCFEERNVHFYVNCCGFIIVDRFQDSHESADSDVSPVREAPGNGDMFLFRKLIH